MAIKKKPEEWITVHGVHIPVYEGENKKQAVDNVTERRGNTMSFDKVTNKKQTSNSVVNSTPKQETQTQVQPTAKENTTTIQQPQEDVNTQMKRLQEGGNVDLFKRPQVPASMLKQYGWKDAGEGTATVFSSTYTNEDGSKAGNFTPIQANEDGKVVAILTEEELTEYAEGVLAGEIDDYLGLQIGAFSEGDNALEDAEKLAELIHELQEKYYLKPKSNKR